MYISNCTRNHAITYTNFFKYQRDEPVTGRIGYGTNRLRDETVGDETVGDETVAGRIKRPDTFYTTYETLSLFVVNLNSMLEYFELDISRQKAFVFCTDILNTQNGKFSHPLLQILNHWYELNVKK